MPADRADVLFVGGTVWTGGQPSTPVTAVAVGSGRIIAVADDAIGRRQRSTEVVDLTGKTLLPGFRDGHLHPLHGGVEALDCDLVDAADVDDVLGRLRRFAAGQPQQAWLLGYGYRPELLPRGVGRAAVLDTVVADRPVALWSSDHHMVWCNSRAMTVAGITPATPDPPRGTIVRAPDGAPAGTLLEDAARLLDPHLPTRGIDKLVRGLEAALERLTRAGLVWGQDALVEPDDIAAYQRVADAGRLTVGIDLACKVDVDGWRDELAILRDVAAEVAAADARRSADGVPGGAMTATTVKFFVDGVIEAGTGHLLEPYCTFGDHHATGDDHGIANWEPAELVDAAVAMDAAGFQLHLHAIGDAAVRTSLDVFEAVSAANGPRDRRPVVAHTHLVHPADLARFRQLGAVANFEPLWAQPNAIMTELTEPRLGPERSRRQYPIGSLVRDGAHVSFGSDWPVSSYVPLEGIRVAVSRQTAAGQPAGGWLPAERVTIDQALAAYTVGTAYQAGQEANAGRIAVGQDADLVVLDADIETLPIAAVGDVEVAATWLGGIATHRG